MPKRTSTHGGGGNLPPVFRRGGLALLCCLALRDRATAQDILTAPPQTPATPSAVQELQAANPMQVFASPEAIPSPIPIQWGPVTAHPHVDYQFSYGNGIESAPGRTQDSIVQNVSPGVLFNLGDHWTLDYTPRLTYYSSTNFQNTLAQSVHLDWGTAYGNDWIFNGSQSYARTSEPQVETAAQTGQETYSTALNASYQMNDKMSLNLGLSQNFNDILSGGANTGSQLNLEDTKAWSTMDWLNYQFWPRFNVGLGIGTGYNQMVNSPDSLNEQYQARANWRATDKISFQLSGGLEDQQYLSGGAAALVTPIFSATIQYQPFEQTQVTVGASRTVSQSGFQSQVTENTGVNVGLNQRLLGRLHLSLSGAYNTTEYLASVVGLSTSRSDNNYSFNARLSCPVLKRGTISVFYTYTDNASTQSGFAAAGTGYGFTSKEVGFEIGYQY